MRNTTANPSVQPEPQATQKTSQKTPKRKSAKPSAPGYVVLENYRGETVRVFSWSNEDITVVARADNKRVETVADTRDLEADAVEFSVLAVTSLSAIKVKPVQIGIGRGRIRWVEQIQALSGNHQLQEDRVPETKQLIGWTLALQAGLVTALVLAGIFGQRREASEKPPGDVSVTLLSAEAVQKMAHEAALPAVPTELPAKPEPAALRLPPREIVVAPALKKIRKDAPIPTHSTSRVSRPRPNTVASEGPRGGGYVSSEPRGYGTNERHMNSIGALAALKSNRVAGGNGGGGGLNLQAVGTEPGSGAGGKGHGGFGSNGGGGHGLGGLGVGQGQGLANSMYGKGLVAAPFGDGSAAPGSGGYGTRGKMGGGAQGAGYGTETVVGSWKGTGPRGPGAAGSGAGTGDPNGSPFGTVDGNDDDAVVTGGLDMDSIREIIMRNMGQIRYCYEQGLQKHPSLAGRVTVNWQISGSGRVSAASIRHSSVRSAQVESCMLAKIQNWQFPKPHGGVNVAVVYPFNLQRTLSMR